MYYLAEIKYKNKIFNVVSSYDFLKDNFQIITLEKLFKNYYGKSLHESIWNIHSVKDRLQYIVNNVIKITGLKDFGKYMNIVLTIDALFLNEDRHTHNLAVLMNENGEFDYCPIFDNGAGLLADILYDYQMDEDVYKLINSVKSKTISLDFDEALNASEILYGNNIYFNFTKNDIDSILGIDFEGEIKSIDDNPIAIYPLEYRKRVIIILLEQMRKYSYLFN